MSAKRAEHRRKAMAATTALAAAAAVDANDPVFGAVFLCHRKLRPMTQKRSARIALRRNGRMSLTRPAASGESCFAGFFFAATAAGVCWGIEPPCAVTSANRLQRPLFQTVVRLKTTPARSRGESHG